MLTSKHISGVRALSRLCSKRSQKQPFNVNNRTGGSDVVSHSAIATAALDGYTLGIITVENLDDASAGPH
jgi:Tripartite tricarboxylate transporter family receptor